MLQVHRFVAAERSHTDRRGANGSGAKTAQTNGKLHLSPRRPTAAPDPVHSLFCPCRMGQFVTVMLIFCQKYRQFPLTYVGVSYNLSVFYTNLPLKWRAN
jgi:hypothetical protein